MARLMWGDRVETCHWQCNNDETQYREEVVELTEWCGANNLSLNVSKTKELQEKLCWPPPPLTIDSSTVERVSSTKILGGAHHREPHLDSKVVKTSLYIKYCNNRSLKYLEITDSSLSWRNSQVLKLFPLHQQHRVKRTSLNWFCGCRTTLN